MQKLNLPNMDCTEAAKVTQISHNVDQKLICKKRHLGARQCEAGPGSARGFLGPSIQNKTQSQSMPVQCVKTLVQKISGEEISHNY